MTPSLLDVWFLLCLVLAGGLRLLWPTRHYTLFGAAASALLIGFAAPATFAAITVITLLVIFPIHRLYRRYGRREPSRARFYVGAGIVLLVALMVAFKVHRHFAIPWVSGNFLPADALALIGFSYFLFRAIGFLHIQTILPIDERTPWGLLYFLLFPPTLTSGPIHKFQDFRQQLDRPAPLDAAVLRTATYRITRGFFRKLVLAYLLNGVLEKLLAHPSPTIVISVLIVVCLFLYFYFDFAGYSDIAIGFGLILGIRVPENFRKPFQATSVSEFWRNWHITLVDWLRDNVFIPLGGMKSSRLRAASLAFLVMFLCGLWHGLTWSFVAWGVWHGSILFAEAMLGTSPMPPSERRGPRYWGRVLWTNARVAAGSLFFLPDAATTVRVLSGFTRL